MAPFLQSPTLPAPQDNRNTNGGGGGDSDSICLLLLMTYNGKLDKNCVSINTNWLVADWTTEVPLTVIIIQRSWTQMQIPGSRFCMEVLLHFKRASQFEPDCEKWTQTGGQTVFKFCSTHNICIPPVDSWQLSLGPLYPSSSPTQKSLQQWGPIYLLLVP